jgi:drug/metabolite transporter (DMT)-like permease
MVYMAGLVQLPLANATAINLATPLFITVLAVLVLRERVDALRWGLIISGFVGVLLVVQPRSTVSTVTLGCACWGPCCMPCAT